LTVLTAVGLAEATRRVAARPLIIVADPARLAEVGPLLSGGSDCLVLVTRGHLVPSADPSGPAVSSGSAGRVVPPAPVTTPDSDALRRDLPA
jgi:hypothetical protein